MVVIFEIIIRNSIVITTLPKYLTIKIIYAQDHCLQAVRSDGLPRPPWRTMWNLHPAAEAAAPHVSRRELMWSGGGRGSSGSTSSPPPTIERHPSSFVLVVDMASKTTTTTTTTTPTAAASKIEGAHLWKKATAQQLLSSVVVLGLRHRPRLFAWNRELKRRIVVVSIDQQAGKRRSYSYSSQHRASRSL